MVVVFFRPVKRTELAINIADICVVDVAINDVGHDLVAVSIVGGGFGSLPAGIRQRPEHFQRQPVQFACFLGSDPPAIQNLVHQFIFLADYRHKRDTTLRFDQFQPRVRAAISARSPEIVDYSQ